MSWLADAAIWLKAYLEANAVNFDVTINGLLGGKPGQTLSLRAAIGAGWTAEGRTGPRKPGWCLFCRFLSIAVQRGHCRLQFSSAPSPIETYVRAAIGFAVGIGAVVAILNSLLELVRYLF
jgi:hypothetical protein